MKCLALAAACALGPSAAVAQPLAEESSLESEPLFAGELRRYYYEQLEKDPWRALGAELLMPGAGNYYVGLYTPAAITFGLSCVGASLWVAGAIRDQPALTWTGIGAFTAARTYGVISAPIGAVLLNAVFRQQLGIHGRY